MSWDLSCPDWESRLRDGRSLVPDLPLDLVAGSRAVAVFNKLRLADVPGTPTLADSCGTWFTDLVRALFGALDPRTRERFIRELFVLVPKKNSKTSYGALMMLTALLLNERPNAPFLMTAPVQDTAELAFNQIAGAIRLDAVLDKKLHIRDHLKTIVHRETKASLEIMTFDPAVVTGRKVVGALIDELHVLAKTAKAASALRQLRGGMLPFPEAFLAFITTQSEEQPTGVFKAELEKARGIRDGQRHGAMLPVLYEFPPAMQKQAEVWRDPANWGMVTPNAGRSITIERLVDEFRTAEETSQEELISWASQHLNVEIGLALQSDHWTGGLFWTAQGDREVTLEYLLARCDVVTFGIDGGGLDDMLGASALGREKETGDWLHWAKAWIHPVALERRKKNIETYRGFEADGDLVIVNELGEDLEQLVGHIQQVEASGLLDRIGVDAVGIGQVLDAIDDAGIDAERIVAIPQGWKLAGAVKTTERRLAEGTLRHGDSRLMAWCVGNAKVEARGNAVIITKQAAGFAKIDPLIATFNAVALMSMNPQPRQKKFQMFFA